MEDCIFCKILKKEIPSSKIWEDDEHYAFFDLFPNCKGQALVIPKKHHDSQLFEMGEDSYGKLLLASKQVAAQLKLAFQVQRVGMIMEGMGVNHVHIKLYPMHGLTREWTPRVEAETQFFEEYPGHLSTQQGDMLTSEQIKELEDIIHNET